jgi:outer membrane protein TolC
VAHAALEEKNLQTAERQFGLGGISRMDYLTQKNTTETARISVESAKLNLFQAVQSYDNLLNGSAG